MRMNPIDDSAIRQAVALLRDGKLIGMPTETVYGLAADALNSDACRRVFAAKGRPADHPLIVHVPDLSHLDRWASRVPREALALGRAFWPGPLTMILPAHEDVPSEVTGGQASVGVRVPAHPVAQALLKALDSGVAAPSANRFGRISPTTAAHVREELGDAVAMVLDGGPCDVGIESTIVDLSRLETQGPVVLRPGAISAEAIAAVIGRPVRLRGPVADPSAGALATSSAADVPRVSGSLAAHYAPATRLQLVASAALPAAIARCIADGTPLAVLSHSVAPDAVAEAGQVAMWLHAPDDAAGFAHDLYADLRALDAANVSLILVEAPPAEPAWGPIADRLGRAATGSGATVSEHAVPPQGF